MKWRGETEDQWKRRVGAWHRHYCLFPRQMMNGNWVWLEHCWSKCEVWAGRGTYWKFSDAVAAPEEFKPTPPRTGSGGKPPSSRKVTT